MILILLALVVFMFVAVVFVGAPYVPTHKKAIKTALDMLPPKKDDLVVDLGSGDGAFLLAAASRGYRALGYEVNPILWLVSYLRALRHGGRVRVRLANFWSAKLPKETSVVFIFLAKPYMKRLAKKLDQVASDRTRPLFVVSYGFEIPGFKPLSSNGAINLYKLAPARRQLYK